MILRPLAAALKAGVAPPSIELKPQSSRAYH